VNRSPVRSRSTRRVSEGGEKGGGRRHLGNKAMVVRAAEIRGKGSGRIRMKRIAAGARDSVTTFVREVVEKGGGVGSDGRQSSRSLPEHGYRHTRRIVAGRAKEASTLLPRVQRVASLLKRWLLGMHHGAVRREHLASYLDECAFRVNRRTSQHRGKLFYRLVQHAVVVSPAPDEAIIKHGRGRQGPKHTR
jgi:ISXO2-like transposase domain